MIDLLLLLSMAFYAASVFVLLRGGRKCGIVGFVYLFWLHAIIGFGYLFLAMYRRWSWGPLYPSWANVYLEDTAYLYVCLICLALLIFGWIRLRFHRGDRHVALPRLPFHAFSRLDLLVVGFCLLTYLVGIKFGTLRVGIGLLLVLPYRLNGIIEIVVSFFFPLYLSLLSLHSSRGFWIGFAITVGYALINLAVFGSKFSSIYPIAIFISIMFLSDRLRIAKLLLPIIVVLGIYTILNPYYFRSEIKRGTVSSPVQLIRESARDVRISAEKGSNIENCLLGIRNLCHRITGIIPMQIAIDASVPMWDAIKSRGLVTDVRRYYNEKVLRTPLGTSNATGHFGFFMVMLGQDFLGFCAAMLTLVASFCICLHLDRRISERHSPADIVVGITFVLMLLPFLIDGNYDKLSGYLKLAFSLLVVKCLLPYLFLRNGPEPCQAVAQNKRGEQNPFWRQRIRRRRLGL